VGGLRAAICRNAARTILRDREPVKAIGITCPHAIYFVDFGNKTRAAALEEVQTVSAKAGKLVTEGPSTGDGLIPASTEDVQRLTR
jgi:hypothetical protein